MSSIDERIMRLYKRELEQGKKRKARRNCYVYEYAYPASMGGTVFYVGKGKGARINFHEKEARRGVQSAKCDAIREIWAAGEEVVKRKVRENLTDQEALDLEAERIQFYGKNLLTNFFPQGRLDSIIPVHICLFNDFRREMEEPIKQYMLKAGIDPSKDNCYQYLQEICMQAIRERLANPEK